MSIDGDDRQPADAGGTVDEQRRAPARSAGRLPVQGRARERSSTSARRPRSASGSAATSRARRAPGGAMIGRVAAIDFLVTETEAEALLAEQQFIKRHRPRFNIRLRDDKSYPYIGISLDEEFPRVYFTRERHRSARLYFGPYSIGEARARDARPARQAVPVPHLRGPGAGPALGRAVPRLLHQALPGALRRLHRPRGVPAQDRRDRRLPLRPLPRRRARPRAQDGRGGRRAEEFERAAVYATGSRPCAR